MGKRFRIALSFAGENRVLVEEIAQILATQFDRDSILYDNFHKAEFARPDLALHLPDLYKKESDLVVLVFCDDYEKKRWCNLEWRAIYSLICDRQDQDIMLMRFSRLEPVGLHGLAGFIDLDGLSAFQVAGHILERLALNERRPRDHYSSRIGALQSLLPSPQSQTGVGLPTPSSYSDPSRRQPRPRIAPVLLIASGPGAGIHSSDRDLISVPASRLPRPCRPGGMRRNRYQGSRQAQR